MKKKRDNPVKGTLAKKALYGMFMVCCPGKKNILMHLDIALEMSPVRISKVFLKINQCQVFT